MKIIKQRFEIIDKIDSEQILKKIEICGRVCYQTEAKDFETTKKFVKNLIDRGHESVLEHVSITVKFITDRAIANEIVRHRIASYSQESSRYTKYDELEIIDRNFDDIEQSKIWYIACTNNEYSYLTMLNEGCKSDQARDILPLCTKTELIMTANIREWRHFLKLRTAKAAHPQMRELTIPLLHEFYKQIPILFDDLFVICKKN